MASWKQVQAKAKKLGVKADKYGITLELQCPEKHCFTYSQGLHCIFTDMDTGAYNTWKEVYGYAMMVLNMGIEPCDCGNC